MTNNHLNHDKTIQLTVSGMDCPNEEQIVRDTLQTVSGIDRLRFNLPENQLTIKYKPSLISRDRIIELLEQRGFEVKSGRSAPASSRWSKYGWVSVSGVGLLLAVLSHWVSLADPITKGLLLVAIVSGGVPIAPKAWSGLRSLRFDMNVLMCLAVLGAMAIGEWYEAAMVVFLFSVSHMLEHLSFNRANEAVRSLLADFPSQANRMEGATIQTVPVERVRVNDRILVRPGEQIPLDGLVVDGFSYVNESAITGEATPVAKESNHPVYSGSMNQDGSLIVKVEKTIADSTISKVIGLIEQAKQNRAPIERTIDRFSQQYTPAVISLAILICVVPPLFFQGVWSEWFYRSLVLLLISCPCALVLSTPISVVCALASAARNGVLIKGGGYLEEIQRVKTVAFDKTGTLTQGQLTVASIYPFNGQRPEQVLRVAAAIESHSQHPMAQAIREYASRHLSEPLPSVKRFSSLPGRGAVAEIDDRKIYIGSHRLFHDFNLCSEEMHENLLLHERDERIAVGIAEQEGPIGSVLFENAIRDEAKTMIQQLKQEGVERIVMVSGDNAGTAQKVADELRISEWYGELLPEDKVALIRRLVKEDRTVIMVGDGVNDAPAMAASTVGVAMGVIGSDVALETAPVALMKDDLTKIPWLIRHSRRTVSIIQWNIFIALFIKLVFVALAIPGLATLWMAILADTGNSLLVISNGMRLLKIKA